MTPIIECMTREKAREIWAQYGEEADKFSEANDCAVRALSAVSGVSYAAVNKWLIAGGYRKPRTGTNKRPYLEFLREHGLTARVIAVSPKTVRSFQLKRYQGRFLVRVRGHILAVIDGQAIDWADMRLHRIKEVIQIVD